MRRDWKTYVANLGEEESRSDCSAAFRVTEKMKVIDKDDLSTWYTRNTKGHSKE